MSLFLNILCCIDLTDHNDDIVQYTKELLREDSKILLVHTCPKMQDIKHYVPHIDEYTHEFSENMQNEMQAFKEKHFAGLDVEIIILEGSSSMRILELADKRCASIIIMGTMSKTWFGITIPHPSNAVADKTHIPLMLIPNNLTHECTPHP